MADVGKNNTVATTSAAEGSGGEKVETPKKGASKRRFSAPKMGANGGYPEKDKAEEAFLASQRKETASKFECLSCGT